MEEELRRHLTVCAHAYAEIRKLEMVTVARHAAGDWRFFERLSTGSFTARKYDAIMGWFATNWPENVPWPEDVPRPDSQDAAA